MPAEDEPMTAVVASSSVTWEPGGGGWPVQGNEPGNPWCGKREAERQDGNLERGGPPTMQWGALSRVTCSPKDLG